MTTLFVDNTTVVTAAWLNDTDTKVQTTLPAATALVQTNLNTTNTNLSNEITRAQAAEALLSTVPFRNRALNSDMSVSQVNGGTATTPSTTASYPIDQFQHVGSQVSKLTYQQVADAPAGFKYSTKISVASQFSPAATDYFLFRQNLEGLNLVDLQLGLAGAKTLACSNWIKGSVAGTYSVSLENGASNRSYVGTISVTTSWAPVVIVLVGDTTGTWATDNTVGLTWTIDLGSGTNFNTTAGSWQGGDFKRTAGSVTFVNQVAGSTLNITGVQVEVVPTGATQGTAFEVLPYETQLRRCQRYLELGNIRFDSVVTTGNNYSVPVFYKVTKRTTPTISVVNGSVTSFNATANILGNNLDGFSVYHASTASAAANFVDTWTSAAQL